MGNVHVVEDERGFWDRAMWGDGALLTSQLLDSRLVVCA